MFIITLTYLAPLEQLDARMTDHVKFLQRYYKENVFLTSGRQVPRTGGIIVAAGKSKMEIEVIMKTDPFCADGLAEYNITEFLNSQMHPVFKEMIAKLPAPE